MDIKQIIHHIKHALFDIKDEFNNFEIDYQDYIDTFGKPQREDPLGYALFKIMKPQLLGMILGFAIARIFHSGFYGYLIFGIIFAFLTGTWSNHEFNNLDWKYSLWKNFVLTSISILTVIIFLFLGYIFTVVG
ncbi:MAG: hypothetical protein K2G63_01035, partial [Oscillospiraceae bacterium]|nr:hypothetical protein [Oscillospiraceae bacterium]